MTTLLIARFPIVVAIGSLSTGGLSLVTLALVGVAVLATAPFYGFMLGIVREQAAEQRSAPRDIRQP